MPKKIRAESVDIYKRVCDTITAAATLVLALTLVVTADGYRREERASRLQRTLSILTRTNDNYAGWETQRNALFLHFPDRWKTPMTAILSQKKAQTYFDISSKPATNEPDYIEWSVARRHLNDIEALAFAYVHDLADQETLAAAECVYMAKSYRYFQNLIDAFRAIGPGQSWQVISQAVTSMETLYGGECEKLHNGTSKS